MPVERIAATARERGIPLLVDGAHVPGLAEDPLAGLECDAWIGNLHKFGCTPRGTSALIARGPLRDAFYPLIDSWAGEEPFPDRFDTQGTIDATSYLAAPAALRFIDGVWGWDTARTYMKELADYAESLIAAAFAEATGADCAVDVGMPVNALRLVRLPEGLGVSREEADALRDRVAAELGVEAAFTSFGGTGYFRLSTHVYNTAADYEDFAERCVPALVDWARTPPAPTQ
jgi:isopenicillin-N epimerase